MPSRSPGTRSRRPASQNAPPSTVRQRRRQGGSTPEHAAAAPPDPGTAGRAQRQRERRERRLEYILTRAVQCFSELGFHRASMAQVCAAAEMSPGNFYQYFRSKDDLLFAIADLERHKNRKILERLAEAQDFVPALCQALEAYVVERAPVHGALTMELEAEAMHNEALHRHFARNEAAVRRGLAILLRRAAQRGQIDPGLDLDATAAWLVAVAEGTFFYYTLHRAGRTRRFLDLFRTAVERLLRPPAAPPSAAAETPTPARRRSSPQRRGGRAGPA